MDAVIPRLRTPRVMVAVTTAVIVLLALFAAWRWVHPPPTVNYPYVAALIEVRNVLAHPKGAVYSRYDYDPAAIVHHRHDGDYEVTGWVEADNGFGQRIHRNWRCIVRPQGGDQWLPVYVQVGQREVGTYVPDTP
jgi:hypothetical protein